MAKHGFQPGDIFEDRYEITTVLGLGGFAVVYRARQLDLDRDVALKILRLRRKKNEDDLEKFDIQDVVEEGVYTETLVKRFEQEARLVSQLRDPRTITVYDYGQTDDGLLFMVFEYVDGQDLSTVLREESTLSPERTVFILKQVLKSLREAHGLGVLHRDIKPGNIMLYEHVGEKDQVKVLDFGIATRILEDHPDVTSNLTQDGAILGTPRYMSPEQIRHDKLTPASDIYSLGLLVYEMLVGSKPVKGSSSIEMIGQQLDPKSFELPKDLEVPETLRRIVERMIAKNPMERFREVEDVQTALEYWDQKSQRPGRTSEPTMRLKADGDDATMMTGPPVSLQAVLDEEEAERAEKSSAGIAPWKLGAAVAAVGICAAGIYFFASGTEESVDSVRDEAPSSEVALQETEGKKVGAEEKVEWMDIETRPERMPVQVDGVFVGRSPARISLADVKFPLEISAENPSGAVVSKRVERPQSRVNLEFEEAVGEKEAAPERPAKPEKKPAAVKPPADVEPIAEKEGGGEVAVKKPEETEKTAGGDQPAEDPKEEPAAKGKSNPFFTLD